MHLKVDFELFILKFSIHNFRECNVYEWTQKFPKLIAPKIIHIKKHSKEGSGVVVMEDVSEKGQEQDPVKGLMVREFEKT